MLMRAMGNSSNEQFQLCAMHGVLFSMQCVLYRMCSLSIECVLYRMCSL